MHREMSGEIVHPMARVRQVWETERVRYNLGLLG